MKSLTFLFLVAARDLRAVRLAFPSHVLGGAVADHRALMAWFSRSPWLPPEGFEREPAAGLPVPIYPGTRVETAEIQPIPIRLRQAAAFQGGSVSTAR